MDYTGGGGQSSNSAPANEGLRFSEATIISAQSQVLDNPDLLEFIFSFLHVSITKTTCVIRAPHSQHLLWASLTCRTFFNPAMNVLWRSMDSWMPLLRLISNLTRHKTETDTMVGVISEQDLQRLDLYGRRIRRLDLQLSRHPVSSYLYTYLSQLRHCDLFPALRELAILNIGAIPAETLPGLFLAPSSSLSKASIYGITSSTESVAASLLQSINMKVPTLEVLSLAGRITTCSLNLVNQFSKLETLQIDGNWGTTLPGDIFDRLSALTSLKRFRIALYDRLSLTPSTLKAPPFKELRSLEILSSATLVLVILQNMAAPHLRKIYVDFSSLGQNASPDCLGQCIQRISLMTTATQSLSVRITANDASVRIPQAQLKWLKMRPHITDIDITVDFISPGPFSRLLETSKGIWPSIKTLIVRSGKSRTATENLSIVGLPQFLVYLPNLTHLAISLVVRIDSNTIHEMRMEVKSQTTCHKLQELVMLPFEGQSILFFTTLDDHVDATVENAFVLSRYINHFCPHLRHLDLSRIQVRSVDQDWCKGVEVMVQGLQEARNQGNVCQAKG